VKKILVISDTHLSGISSGLPEPVVRELTSCDMLIHAGDFTGMNIYRELNSITNLVAVHGNSDGIGLTRLLPSSLELNVENIRLGLVHGNGSQDTTIVNACSVFKNCDIIIFGHSHFPFNQIKNGVLMFNPGSPTDPRRAPGPSYGLITVENNSFNAKIVSFH
jgi:hypothetical protein